VRGDNRGAAADLGKAERFGRDARAIPTPDASRSGKKPGIDRPDSQQGIITNPRAEVKEKPERTSHRMRGPILVNPVR
jgi:hypothetical protein